MRDRVDETISSASGRNQNQYGVLFGDVGEDSPSDGIDNLVTGSFHGNADEAPRWRLDYNAGGQDACEEEKCLAVFS